MKHKVRLAARQVLALVLCMAMLLPMLPVSAFATGADGITDEKGAVVEPVQENETTDGSEETTTDGSEETTTDGSEETTTDGSEETTTDGSEETTTDGSEETTTDGSEETTTDGSEETTTDGSEETTTDGSEDTPTDSTEETTAVDSTEVPVIEETEEATVLAANGPLDMGSVTLPAYPDGGNISKLLTLDCGYSTQNDGRDGNAYKSYVRIVTSTTQEHFDGYRQSLKAAGYNEVSYRETQNGVTSEKNCFAKFIASDGSHSVYFYRVDNYGKYDGSDTNNSNNHEHCNEARIIVDTNPDTVRTFSYEAQSGGDGKTELYMYGLTMADDGYDLYNEADKATQQRRSCGQLIVMKMPDNSLFINDGGGVEQFNDEKTCQAFLEFCREITGVPEGQKMVINTWFITHSHRDHYSGFPAFLSKYSDQFDLKNIMYNFEDNYGGDLHSGSHLFIQKVAQLFPDAKYYKPHTGETFNIAEVDVEVMLTMEERLKFSTADDGKYISGDFNDTSTVLMMSFDGVKFLLTGDMNQLSDRLISMYPAENLKADVLQVPHHGFNNLPELCKTVAPTHSFYTQNKNAVNGPRNDLMTNYANMSPYLGRVYFGGSETVGLAVTTTASENGASTYAANGGTLTEIYNAPVVTAEYTPAVDGVYIIHPALDKNKAVAIEGDSSTNGAKIHLWDTVPSSHRFIIRSQGDGTYTIQSVLTGKFLDPTTTKNAQATIYEGLSYDSSDPDSNHRRWKFQQNGDGTVSIISAATETRIMDSFWI